MFKTTPRVNLRWSTLNGMYVPASRCALLRCERKDEHHEGDTSGNQHRTPAAPACPVQTASRIATRLIVGRCGTTAHSGRRLPVEPSTAGFPSGSVSYSQLHISS